MESDTTTYKFTSLSSYKCNTGDQFFGFDYNENLVKQRSMTDNPSYLRSDKTNMTVRRASKHKSIPLNINNTNKSKNAEFENERFEETENTTILTNEIITQRRKNDLNYSRKYPIGPEMISVKINPKSLNFATHEKERRTSSEINLHRINDLKRRGKINVYHRNDVYFEDSVVNAV